MHGSGRTEYGMRSTEYGYWNMDIGAGAWSMGQVGQISVTSDNGFVVSLL